MDSKTLNILRRIHNTHYGPSRDNLLIKDYGLPPDVAELINRGWITIIPVCHLTSVGREALEAEEVKIRESKFWRRMRRHAISLLLSTFRITWHTVLGLALAAVITFFRQCARPTEGAAKTANNPPCNVVQGAIDAPVSHDAIRDGGTEGNGKGELPHGQGDGLR